MRNSPFERRIFFFVSKVKSYQNEMSLHAENPASRPTGANHLILKRLYTLYIKLGDVSLRRLVATLLVLHVRKLRGRTQSENKYFPTKRWWRLSIKYGRDYFTSKASNGVWVDKPRKLSTGGPNMKRMHLAHAFLVFFLFCPFHRREQNSWNIGSEIWQELVSFMYQSIPSLTIPPGQFF